MRGLSKNVTVKAEAPLAPDHPTNHCKCVLDEISRLSGNCRAALAQRPAEPINLEDPVGLRVEHDRRVLLHSPLGAILLARCKEMAFLL